MRMTFITPYLPHRRIAHGGGVSIRNMIAYLARNHDLTVVSLLRNGEADLVRSTAEDLHVDIQTIPYHDSNSSGAERLFLFGSRLVALLGSLSEGRPYYVRKYWSPSLSRAVIKAVATSNPEVVQIEYLQLGLLTRDLRLWRDTLLANGQQAPGLFTSSHELGSLPRRRRLEHTSNPLYRLLLKREISAWRRLESDITHWADRTFCVTDQDRELLESAGGISCVTMPLGVDTESVQAIWEGASSEELLFVGSFAHRPNRLAAAYLVDEVWPGISQSPPVSKLILAGPGSVEFLADRGGGAPRRGGRGVRT